MVAQVTKIGDHGTGIGESWRIRRGIYGQRARCGRLVGVRHALGLEG
jgi:hypothetical protein